MRPFQSRNIALQTGTMPLQSSVLPSQDAGSDDIGTAINSMMTPMITMMMMIMMMNMMSKMMEGMN